MTARPRLRFSLRTLLLLPLIFALGWWWVTWPDRTFEAFADAIRNEQFDAAIAMVDSCDVNFGYRVDEEYKSGTAISMKSTLNASSESIDAVSFIEQMDLCERGASELFLGRIVYVVRRPPSRLFAADGRPAISDEPSFQFVVERGSIKLYFR